MQVYWLLTPLRNGLGLDKLLLRGEIGRDTQPEHRRAGRQYRIENMIVTIRRFNKDLCLFPF